MSEITPLLDLIQSFGVTALLLYLYINERKAHDATRTRYFEDLRGWGDIHHLKRPENEPTPDNR